jgi:MFS transporter
MRVMSIAGWLPRPYRDLFATSGVPSLSASGFAAQLTQAAGPLGLLLVTQQATGSLASAGAVVAAFAVGAGCGRPLLGGLIDRRGPTPVLVGAAAWHGAALAAAALLAAGDAGAWTLAAAAAVAGLGVPAISQSMRVVLVRIAPGQRETAYAAIAITQELAILLGPVLLGGLVAAWSAPAALVVLALAASAGALWFALIPATRGLKGPISSSLQHESGSLLAVGLLLVLAIAGLFGVAMGAGEVAIPAFAIEHGHRSASGLLVAALSLGGIGGGLALGVLRWSAPAATRATILLGLLAAGLTALAAAPSMLVIGAMLLAAGMPLTPAITNIALLLDDQAPSHAIAQSFGWLSTAIALGAGVGSALAGPLAQHAGSDAAFLGAGGAAALSALAAHLASRRLALG